MTALTTYGRHSINEEDIAAVVAALRSDFLTGGPLVARFEDTLAGAVCAPHAVSCSSGTAALHLAYQALGLGPEHFVVVPSITFLATANAARCTGAEIVFADVDAGTGLATPQSVADALRRGRDQFPARRPGAVCAVHLAGQPADMADIAAAARAEGAAIVEDACHAIGATTGGDNVPIGSCAHSDAAIFSFHPVKTVAMGEGGAVTTRNAAVAERCAAIRNHGMTRDAFAFRNTDMALDDSGEPNPWYYEMTEIGYNYRASDLHCALGLSQISRLESFVERRRALAALYDDALTGFANKIRPIERVASCKPAWHLYAVLIDFDHLPIDRAMLMRRLAANGIGSQVHYIPVHRQPYYQERYGACDLPGADSFYRRTLSLPLFHAMEDGDVQRVVDALAKALLP